jgi:hypothetical protein
MQITLLPHQLKSSFEPRRYQPVLTELEVARDVIDSYVSESTLLGAIPLGGAAVGALRAWNLLAGGHTRAASEFALSSALNLAGVASFCAGFLNSDVVTTGCAVALMGLGGLAANTAASSHVASTLGF